MPPKADSRPRSDERVVAPLRRRACEVTDNRQTGGYRIFSALDAAGPEPRAGQFYMLAAAEHWGTRSGRPYLPRAFSVAEAEVTDGGVRLDFLVEDVGPGTERLASLRQGERLWVTGPLGRPFSHTSELNSEAAGAILVGGGIGLAPLAILRRQLADRGVAIRTLLGFRDQEHSGGVDELFGCCEVRMASEDGHVGHRGYVTELPGGAPGGGCGAIGGRLRVRAPGNAGDGPRTVPGAGRRRGAGHGDPDGLRLRCLHGLCGPAGRRRLHAPVHGWPGGQCRGDRDRPRARDPVTDGFGGPARRARSRASGAERVGHLRRHRRPAGVRRCAAGRVPVLDVRLEDDHARASSGQPAAQADRDAGGDDQLDRAPEQGTGGLPRGRPPGARRAAGPAVRLGDGDQPRRVRAAGRGRGGSRRGGGPGAQRLVSKRRIGPDRRRAGARRRSRCSRLCAR